MGKNSQQIESQINQINNQQQSKEIQFFNRKKPASGKIYYEDEHGNKYDLIEIFHNLIVMSKELIRFRKITNKKFQKLAKCMDETFNKLETK